MESDNLIVTTVINVIELQIIPHPPLETRQRHDQTSEVVGLKAVSAIEDSGYLLVVWLTSHLNAER